MIFALDTDTFTLLVKGHLRVTARHAEIVAGGTDEVAIPAVVRAEILRGRFDAITKAANGAELVKVFDMLTRTEDALSPYRILPVIQTVGTHFDRVSAIKAKKRNHADLLIACIALAHGATLVTRNTKDFAGIAGLKVENWAN